MSQSLVERGPANRLASPLQSAEQSLALVVAELAQRKCYLATARSLDALLQDDDTAISVHAWPGMSAAPASAHRAICHQHLLGQIGTPVNQLLMHLAVGRYPPQVPPMPARWHRHLHLHYGLRGRLGSGWRFLRSQMGWWLQSFRTLSKLWRLAGAGERCFSSDALYVHGLSAGQIPRDRSNPGETVFKFIDGEFGHAGGPVILGTPRSLPKEIPSGCAVAQSAFPPLSRPMRWRFAARAGSLILNAVSGWIGRFDYLRPLMLGSALESLYMVLVDEAHLPRQYLFDNSNYAVRPLWTFAVQARGSNVCLYFYSTNIRNFETRLDGAPFVIPQYRLMTWHRVWAFGQDTVEYLRSLPHVRAVHTLDDVPFTDNVSGVMPTADIELLIFDVAPHDPLRLAQLGFSPSYYTEDTALSFMRDILEVAKQTGLRAALKSKRQTRASLRAHSYESTLQDWCKKGILDALDSSIAAVRYIERARFVISAPFTATGPIARMRGVPSIYYDPTSTLRPKDEGVTDPYLALGNGVPLATTRTELARWIAEQLTR